MNGHRSQIKHGGNQFLYQHFNQVDHSILSFRVRILEKIYHHTNDPDYSTSFRRQREEFWIRMLGTAIPYGCNDNINHVGNLSHPMCSSVNVFSLFHSCRRRHRSHGHRHYNPPSIHNVTFNGMLAQMHKPMGIHYIRTKLFAIPLSQLKKQLDEALRFMCSDQHSPESKLVSIISDIGHYRLFQPARIMQQKITRGFLKVNFTNKGIDAINLTNILHNKKVTSCIPSYFEEQTPLISYKYTIPIGPKKFNYRNTLKNFDVDQFLADAPSCSCAESPFVYEPVNHIVTGNLGVVDNNDLRDILSKGPKYREAQRFTWHQNVEDITHSVETYARSWAKREHTTVESLSEWIKTITALIKRRVHVLKHSFDTKPKSVFKDPNVRKCLNRLHEQYVIVPADKASNNIVFVCKKYYHQCLINELGCNSASNDSAYTLTSFSREEIISNHNSVLTSFGIKVNENVSELPFLYWIPKLHKNPYKQRFIAGSAKCSTKPLSALLTIILNKIKDQLHTYCNIVYERSGLNQMWILKNSKSLLEQLSASSLNRVQDIQTFDFSTLYTTIPHSQLKSRLKDLVFSAFIPKSGKRKYSYMVVKGKVCYLVKGDTDASPKYNEIDIVNMINFLIDNIFVVFGGKVFQQTIGIPMGTNCAPLLADLFLYTYESAFMNNLKRCTNKRLPRSFNYTYRYIDDVLSINNARFSEYLDIIYPPELEIKNTTESTNQTSYLDLLLVRDTKDALITQLYDKRDDFSFPIVNFPFLCSNIPTGPAYGVFVSQLIRYARSCSQYEQFAHRSRLLTQKLLNQGYTKTRLISTFRKFYGRHDILVTKYDIPASRILSDIGLLAV